MIKYDPDLAKREIECFCDILKNFLHINIILWYLSFFFGQWKALRRQAYLNLIVTCFETIRLILGSIFNVLHKNFRMKEYLTYTCENLI